MGRPSRITHQLELDYEAVLSELWDMNAQAQGRKLSM